MGLGKLLPGSSGRKRPILLHQAVKVLEILRSQLDGPLADMACAAVSFAFQGLLRKSEYSATPNKPFNPEKSLTMGDMRFVPSLENPRYVSVILKNTKTDAFLLENPELFLPMDAEAPLNACAQLQRYFQSSQVDPSKWGETPLFCIPHSEQPLQGASIHSLVQQSMGLIGENPAEFGSHSLRSGGTTALADAGCPEVVLKTLGRWSSECYRIYARAAFSSVLEWGKRMASAGATVRGFSLHIPRSSSLSFPWLHMAVSDIFGFLYRVAIQFRVVRLSSVREWGVAD